MNKLNKSMSDKLLKICKEKNISINKLATISCLTQSTIEHIVDCKYKDIKLLTIVRICDGLNISLKEFFDDELFDNVDRED